MKTEEEYYDEFCRLVDTVEDGDTELTKSLVRSYCWLLSSIDQLKEKIGEEGLMVEQMVGKNKFQRVEMAENPSLKTLYKMMSQQSAMYGKLHKVLVDSDDGERDEFEEFVG